MVSPVTYSASSRYNIAVTASSGLPSLRRGVVEANFVACSASHSSGRRIAPGAILLPEEWDAEQATKFASTTPLRRLGSPDDAVTAMLYLLDAEYVTGETIVVDGGRRIRK